MFITVGQEVRDEFGEILIGAPAPAAAGIKVESDSAPAHAAAGAFDECDDSYVNILHLRYMREKYPEDFDESQAAGPDEAVEDAGTSPSTRSRSRSLRGIARRGDVTRCGFPMADVLAWNTLS